MIDDKMQMEKDHDKGLPVTVSMFLVAVAISFLFIQVLALSNWVDLENFCSVRLLSEVCDGRQ